MWYVRVESLMEIQHAKNNEGMVSIKLAPGTRTSILMELFTAINQLYAEHGFSGEENALMSNVIKDYLSSFGL